MSTETALNLQPGDEIEMDDRWWTVVQHSINVGAPAPVQVWVRSLDREFMTTFAAAPMVRFNCRRECGH